MRKYIFIGIVCLAAALTYFYFLSSKDSVQYRTEKIKRSTIDKYVMATGTVNPVRTVIIGSQVSGLISQLYVDFNSVVRKGLVVAQIDPVPFEHEVKRAEAALATAIANLEKAKANHRNNERNYIRSKELYANKIISVNDLDSALTAYETGMADVKLAESQVQQAEASLEIAKTNLKHTVIVSPLDGIILSRDVDVGQTVVSSFQTPTLFTIAEDLVHMQVVANVDEADIGMVRIGQDAKFTVDSFPDDVFEGKVVEIRMAPVVFQNVVTYDTIISVDNSSLKLMPGMTATASIRVARAENVLKIPSAALRYTPSEVLKKERTERLVIGREYARKAGSSVWILEHGKLEEVPVRTGVSNSNFTEVLEGNLKEGQKVVIAEITAMPAPPGGTQGVPWRRGRF
ncbi:MAG: efflux RND transporter periplasmic adaptor subunit [Candidatus Loosdrechtia sp.]|uniref:efflux RND transporter periplasmic adaptor subunit n=1 Tax=Candidatus Loosdrechtia sp. TaxID=3101272 RepID=UPI003A6BE6AF|nr:MAG: efflux RND transporter periplasmic adaptor subunit [Candidatus Jettenia sp. AMX2]